MRERSNALYIQQMRVKFFHLEILDVENFTFTMHVTVGYFRGF